MPEERTRPKRISIGYIITVLASAVSLVVATFVFITGRQSLPDLATPDVRIITDTNPYHLSSPNLVELHGTNQDWLVPKGKVVQGEPVVDGADNAIFRRDAFYRFAHSHDAVAVNRLFFAATVQNLSGGAVRLGSIHLTDVKCGAPLRGTRIYAGGGADFSPPRVVVIDLDSARPKPLYFPRMPEWFTDVEAKPSLSGAKPFSFTLEKDKSEAFDIIARVTGRRSCQFKLAIQAIINGKNTRILVTDSSKPFKITGDSDLNYWFYTPGRSGMEWWGPADGSEQRAKVNGATGRLTETD